MAHIGIKLWIMSFDGSKTQLAASTLQEVTSPNERRKFTCELLANCSNSQAEYESLILGLKISLAKNTKSVETMRDS